MQHKKTIVLGYFYCTLWSLGINKNESFSANTSFISATIVSFCPWKSELKTLFVQNLGKQLLKRIAFFNYFNENNAVSDTRSTIHLRHSKWEKRAKNTFYSKFRKTASKTYSILQLFIRK